MPSGTVCVVEATLDNGQAKKGAPCGAHMKPFRAVPGDQAVKTWSGVRSVLLLLLGGHRSLLGFGDVLLLGLNEGLLAHGLQFLSVASIQSTPPVVASMVLG